MKDGFPSAKDPLFRGTPAVTIGSVALALSPSVLWDECWMLAPPVAGFHGTWPRPEPANQHPRPRIGDPVNGRIGALQRHRKQA